MLKLSNSLCFSTGLQVFPTDNLSKDVVDTIELSERLCFSF